mgnify:CR=1 FL=1
MTLAAFTIASAASIRSDQPVRLDETECFLRHLYRPATLADSV